MENDETVPVEGYKCITQFKGQDFSAGGLAIHEENNATIMTMPHLVIKLDK
jgi:hypothetical protein